MRANFLMRAGTRIKEFILYGLSISDFIRNYFVKRGTPILKTRCGEFCPVLGRGLEPNSHYDFVVFLWSGEYYAGYIKVG